MRSLFISGAFVPPQQGRTIDVVDPSTGEIFDTIGHNPGGEGITDSTVLGPFYAGRERELAATSGCQRDDGPPYRSRSGRAGLSQTFMCLSRVPEDRYSMTAIDRWIAATLSRDLVDFSSADGG
jgi:hypothetical protein